jgi:CheY-like chemotaxis protein
VDDSTVSRRILASLLESAGFQVITATGGLEGIDLARKHHPHVVFMDVKMADLDGFSATRRLGADPATAGIPVIVVSASAFGDTRQAAKDAGCVAYLPKPVRAEALFATLQTHIGAQFVRSDQDMPVESVVVSNPAPNAGLAVRLRDAVAIGDFGVLQAIADELIGGERPNAGVGQRLARLVSDFDFDGVRDLAASLAAEQEQSHAE